MKKQTSLLPRAMLWISAATLLVLVWLISPIALGTLFDAAPRTLEQRGSIGESFGAVSALFSALTLFGMIVTLAIQRKDLAGQREELAYQREELQHTRQELKKAADAGIRALHVEILKLSIEHPHLTPVWPRWPDATIEEEQQYLYANLIVAHQEMLYEQGVFGRDDVEAVFRHLFESEIIYRFWTHARKTRAKVTPKETSTWSFFETVESVYRTV
ncbi:hypothetical protein SAMN05421505_106125 [Sinosporangium album]|uniref:Uncharacterized protein n=1 Tax=Sinosporangium album TaxID=504805 RepID=A0A1G7VZ71_9ACTN|nr:DUF6082 family protein [Sinosporangium album]SDG65076.1 hypothetical protein SAMN05421505_106125 [Sinosporangium album]